MKMICKHRCFINDRVYKPGAVVELTKEQLGLPMVKASFVIPEGTAPKASAAAPVAAPAAPAAEPANPEPDGNVPPPDASALPRKELIRRLESMGVAFKGNASTASLTKLYLEQHQQ